MAGSSCGVIPIAIASENSTASITGRDMATLMTKIETVRMPAIQTSSRENSFSPIWNAVYAGGDPSPTAIRPNAVADPVETTTPRADPWCTIVPMNAQVGGTGSDPSPGAACTDFAAGIDSPVSTASSHSSCVASSSRMSAGTTFPMPSVTMSPGTSSRTSTRRSTPSRLTSV